MQPFMPLTASLTAVLGVFAGLLVALDLLLVRWLRLGKVSWKRMDYIWLGFGALGLLGAVAQVRMESASAQLDMYEKRAIVAFDSVKSLVEVYASNPGPICRTFVRSEFSPPPDEFQRIQNEYNTACEWVKQVSEALKTHATSPPRPIDRASPLPPRPQVSDGALKGMFRGLDRQLAYFDQNIQAFEALRQKSKRTPTEETFVYIGPFLLAIALAIRITKVTGELKLES
jgi:hypothetical protein